MRLNLNEKALSNNYFDVIMTESEFYNKVVPFYAAYF